jgi:hypothetical protein
MSLAASRTAARTPDVGAGVAGIPTAPLLVGLITLASFALRLSQIHQSLYGDEVLAYHEIAGHGLVEVVRTVRAGVESSPPLFFVLGWLSAKLGDPTVWIRLPSLILGTATVPVIYLIGRDSVGRRAGVIAAAIFAVSPFATYYGVEARPYATMAFFVALSLLGLLRAVSTGERRWWALYAVATAAAAYTHYTAVFVLGVQAAWSLWKCRTRLRRPLLANALAVLLYLPWLLQVHGSVLGLYGALEPLTAHNVLNDLPTIIPGYPYAALHTIPTIPGLVAILACALAGVVAIVVCRRAGGETAAAREGWLVLLALLAAAAPAGVLLYSLLGIDIWFARALYSSVPAAALMLGTLLAAIPGRLRAIAVAFVLAALVLGTIRSFGSAEARPPFRAAAQFLDRAATPRDPIFMYPSFLSLDQAIPAQLRRPHLVVQGVPARWPATLPGGEAFVVVDDAMATALRIPTPHPRGFALVSVRQYNGILRFTVLAYRAQPSG